MDPYNRKEEPTQYTQMEWVSPETARYWYEERNTDNRRPSSVRIRRWTQTFNEGRYRLSHQGIAFDADGVMVDGQHRCAGLAASDVSGVWMPVSYHVDRASFAVIDTGFARSAGQFLAGPHANVKAAAAKMLVNYPTISIPAQSVDNETVFEVVDALPELHDAVIYSNPSYRSTRIGMTVHTALLTVLLASEVDRSAVEEWATGLEAGAGLTADDPRLLVRSRFALEHKRYNSAGRDGRLEGTYLLVRAWNAFATGERMRKLQLPRASSRISIPEIVTEVSR